MTRQGLINLINRPLFVFIASGFIGAVIFITIYGIGVINPTNVQWLQADMGDMSQHYLGWLFYRQSDWSPVLGSIDNLAYPHGLAVTFMDSIPLLAIPFKLISFMLPEQFQYFGLWGIACYVFMGALGGLVIHRLTHNTPFAILGSMILAWSPLVIQRMFAHTALAGHWIVLAGIYLLIRFNKQSRLWVFLTCWSIVLAISACIHPYFIPMNLAILVMSAIFTFKNFRDLSIRIMIPAVIALGVFFVIGGFVVTDVSGGEVRDYGLNADALINAVGWSSILINNPPRPLAYEAFAYVGFGVVAMGIILAYTLFTSLRRLKEGRLQRLIHIYCKPRWLAAYGIGLAVIVAAVSPTIHVGDFTLVVPMPLLVEKVWSVFRATGRLFWPVYYLIVIGSIVLLYRTMRAHVSQKLLIIFFAIIVALQGFDITQSVNARAKHERFIVAGEVTYISPINVAKWNNAANGRAHIQFIGDAQAPQFFAVGYIAVEQHMTMSDGYFARSPYESVRQTSAAARNDILSGNARRDTLYLSSEPGVGQYAQSSPELNVFKDYDVYVITTK